MDSKYSNDQKATRKKLERIYDCQFCEGKGKLRDVRKNKYIKCPHTKVTDRLMELVEQTRTNTINAAVAAKFPLSYIDEVVGLPNCTSGTPEQNEYGNLLITEMRVKFGLTKDVISKARQTGGHVEAALKALIGGDDD